MGKIKQLYIYGAGGHGKVVKDVAIDNGYKKILFVDDGTEFGFNEFVKNVKKANVFIAIGNNHIRKEKQKLLETLGYNIVTLIHSSAIIGSNVVIEKGVVIMPNVIINTNSIIKKGVILNSACVIEHDCFIDEFAHISPTVGVAGGVKIGKLTHLGIGSKIKENINIGNHVIIGAGAVVINNIEDNKIVAGVPAKEIKE